MNVIGLICVRLLIPYLNFLDGQDIVDTWNEQEAVNTEDFRISRGLPTRNGTSQPDTYLWVAQIPRTGWEYIILCQQYGINNVALTFFVRLSTLCTRQVSV